MSVSQKCLPILIYNLFPLLAGKITNWENHLTRIAGMGFNWIFLNPFNYPGFSGSIYSIKDYYGFHPKIKHELSDDKVKDILREFIRKANSMGIKVMADLVINHTAIDSPLTQQHPQWYMMENGRIKNPCVKEGDIVKVIWGDLAEIDNLNSTDKNSLWNYWLGLVEYYIQLGFSGFRCDAAYQVPADLWKYLIGKSKEKNQGLVYFAENLGCELKDTLVLIDAGFDVIFNSSKYWDFEEPWCMKQYNATYKIAPSISFAESHDTYRLAKELNFKWDCVKTRYLFSTIFSAGVMMPMGLEFGFSKKLDVVTTSDHDWEHTSIDLSPFIQSCNRIKHDFAVFHNDTPIEILQTQNKNVFAFIKSTFDNREKAIIIINKDSNHYQEYYHHNLTQVFGFQSDIKDISPDYPMDHVPAQFHYNLRPCQSKILYARM